MKTITYATLRGNVFKETKEIWNKTLASIGEQRNRTTRT